MKVLCVAEKPSVAKEISRILSDGRVSSRRGHNKYQTILDFECTIPQFGKCQVTFTSVLGHMKETEVNPEFKTWNSCPPRAIFDCPVTKSTKKDMLDVERTLKQEVRGCGALILWTDCDREGENIAFEIVDSCKAVNGRVQVLRAKFSALIPREIRHALTVLAPPNKREADAADARAEIDLRIGAAFTRFQTLSWQRKFEGLAGDSPISFGPCQFPTLGFVVERWEQIQNFVAQDFWYIKMTILKEGQQHPVEFNWKAQRSYDRKVCLAIYQICMENPTAIITSIKRTPDTKRKPLPMSTVTFQKLATKKLRMASAQAMSIAEKLYHSGYLSYPRTETEVFAQGTDLRGIIGIQAENPLWGEYAQQLLGADGKFEWPRAGQHDDHAHPPIHPTRPAPELSGQEKAVYELVTRHFLACCSKDAKGSKTVVEARVADQEFSCNGLQILERNYLDVYPYDVWSDRALPSFVEGEELMPYELMMLEGHTTPPQLLTETELIKLMDKHGIGTDATIAQHITTIQERSYAIKQGQCFLPTDLGVALLHGYKNIGFDMGDSALRREMEQDFKNICMGRKTREQVVQHYVQKFLEIFDQSNARVPEIEQKISERFQLAGVASFHSETAGFSQCGACGGLMSLRVTSGANDKVLFCPTCNAALQTPRGEVTAHDHRCPLCNFQVLSVTSMQGKQYSACPKCFNSPPAIEGQPATPAQKFLCFNCTADCPLAKGSSNTSVRSCPACGSGMRIRQRKDQSGAAFLSCSSYPSCKLALSLPSARSVTVSPTECAQCGNSTRPLVFEFEPGRVPPGLEQRYTACVGGCDRFMNDLLRQANSRDIEEFFRGPSRSPAPVPVPKQSALNSSFANLSAGLRKPQPPSASAAYSQAKQPAYAKPSFGGKPSPFAKPPPPQPAPAAYPKPAYAKPSPAPAAGAGGGSAEDVPSCTCGLTCSVMTTKKEGPNLNRQFFVCPQSREARCAYFKWVDEYQAQAGGGSGGRGRGWSSAPAASSSSASSSGYGRGRGSSSWSGGGSSGAGTGAGGPAANATCYGCGQVGHFKINCPNPGQSSGSSSSYGGARGRGGFRGSGGNKRFASGGRGASFPSKRGRGAATSSTGGTRKCSLCGVAGHTKKKCPSGGGGGGAYESYGGGDYGGGGDDAGGYDGGGDDWGADGDFADD